MRTSNCCGAKVDYDSDICPDPKCGEHCSITCELCDGEGYVEVMKRGDYYTGFIGRYYFYELILEEVE